MAKKKKNTKTIKSRLLISFNVTGSFLIVALVLLIISMILTFVDSKNQNLYLILDIITGIIVLGLLIVFSLSNANIYKNLYLEGFEKARKNFKALVNYDKDFDYIKRNNIEEFKDLNSAFKDLSTQLDGKTIISKAFSLENMKLEYVDEENQIFTQDSIFNNIKALILGSESYRNALIDISYDLGDEEVKEKDIQLVSKTIRKMLGYERMLIALKNNKLGFIVYIPAFDSVSQLEEELEGVIKNISLIHNTPLGRQVVLAKVSVAIYPYSGIDEILDDLRTATRQRKLLNFYFPNKEVESNSKMLITSMNINNTAKLIEEISSIDADPKLFQANIHKIQVSIAKISNYYGFTCAGYIEYDQDKDGYYSSFTHSDTSSFIFKEGVRINRKFIEAIHNCQDKDHSYYFSNRKHVHNAVAKFIDEYRIRSGMFYVLTRGDECVGVIYFLNKSKDLEFDAYMKESLIVSCYALGDILKEMENRKHVSISESRFKDILKLSGIYFYSIDRNTFEISMMSDSLKKLFPNVSIGDPYYRIYGYDNPPKDKEFPLLSGKHVNTEINGKKYESYLVLQNKDDVNINVIIREKAKEELSNRFDDETLMPSYYSFTEALNHQYLINQVGHVLFLKVKNTQDIIRRCQNYGYLHLLRQFNRYLLKVSPLITDVYFYSHDILAIILPRLSEEEVTSVAEKICGNNPLLEMSNGRYQFALSYVDKIYNDASHPKALDMYPAFDEAIKKANELPIDEICFMDTGYERNTSEDGYLFETLQRAFEQNKYIIYYQPILSNRDRLIKGFELLLRVEDEKSHKGINIAKAVKIAEAHGFTPTITSGLIDAIDNLFKKYGYSFFFNTGLTRISINVDFTFFEATDILEKLDGFVKTYNLPKGFIGLEVEEEEIANHVEAFKSITKKAIEYGTPIVADRFTGEKLTPTELNNIGVKELKVSRDLILNIEEDKVREKIISIWDETIKNEQKISFVGIENRVISDEIHHEEHDCYVQGHYFYIPLTEETLIESIRERNVKGLDE